MSESDLILPGTGRGTTRRVVEGRATAIRKLIQRGAAARPSPPTLRVAVPFPSQGRIA